MKDLNCVKRRRCIKIKTKIANEVKFEIIYFKSLTCVKNGITKENIDKLEIPII